jgi:Secretion system C-terminal sorting domain
LLFLLFFFLLLPNAYTQINWEEIHVPDSIVVRSVLVGSNKIIYIGCASLDPSGINPNYGVYKSIDQGQTWIAAGLAETLITSLKMDELGNIYGVSEYDIYKSENQGEDWELLPYCGLSTINLLIHNEDTLFASGWGGIARSYDKGQTWDRIEEFPTSEVIYDISFDNYNNIICGKASPMGFDKGLLISSDWGDTWKKILDRSILSLGIDSKNKIYASSIMDVVFMTQDLGLTWDSAYLGMNGPWSMAINPNDYVIIGCVDMDNEEGGVYASSDEGQTWDAEIQGLRNPLVFGVYLDCFGYLYAICPFNFEDGKLFKSKNSTLGVWAVKIAEGDVLNVFPNPLQHSNTLWIENQNKAIEKIELYNGSGKLAFCETPENAGNKLAISLPKLGAGLYHLVIKFKDGNRECFKQIIY